MLIETIEPRIYMSHSVPHHARVHRPPHVPVPAVIVPTLTDFRSAAILDDGRYGVQLQWSESDPTVTSYQIQRSADGGATWETIAEPANVQDFYFDYPAPDGVTLTYQIAEVRQ